MADKPNEQESNGNYQSTVEDRRRARLLGVVYIILAIFLAWMLFKIWPPTPWPTDKALDENPQLAKNFEECGCPTPTPSPESSRTGNQTANPSSTSTATPTSTPTPKQTPTQTPPAGASSPTSPQGAGASATPKSSPTANPSPKPTPQETMANIPINFFWGYWCYHTSFDERLILLVIIAGMLGSFVHGATSLADFIGNSKFNKNWTWFYLLRPAIGMALALVFYFVIRGGFLTTSGGARDINPYGIAALAGLVGMFSKQATDKLSEVFSTLFRAAKGEGDDKRSGSLTSEANGERITVTDVKPDFVAVNSKGQVITVTGTNFADGCQVFLDANAQTTTFVSATQVTARLADADITAPKVFKLKVVNPDKKESAPVDFAVK